MAIDPKDVGELQKGAERGSWQGVWSHRARIIRRAFALRREFGLTPSARIASAGFEPPGMGHWP
jgi:hypothetical protein